MPLPEEAISCSIREYYFDWLPAEPATFTIECLSPDAGPAEVTSARTARDLDEVTAHMWRSLTYWNEYMLEARAKQVDNEFGGRHEVGKGLANARYSFCFWSLAPDDALVIECDVPNSRYWSWHQYTNAWWRAFEYGSRDHRPLADPHLVRREDPRRRWRTTTPASRTGSTPRAPRGHPCNSWFWPHDDVVPSPSPAS
ncbi:MAG: hypothetical protein U0W40_10250 [Acidimicrobiia bacterium]